MHVTCMVYTWSVHGTCIVCALFMLAVCMAHAWCMHGIYTYNILMNGMCIHAVTVYNHNNNKAAGGTV